MGLNLKKKVKKAVRKVGGIAEKVVKNPVVKTAVGTYFGGPLGAALVGGLNAKHDGAGWGGALKSGLASYVTSGAGGGTLGSFLKSTGKDFLLDEAGNLVIKKFAGGSGGNEVEGNGPLPGSPSVNSGSPPAGGPIMSGTDLYARAASMVPNRAAESQNLGMALLGGVRPRTNPFAPPNPQPPPGQTMTPAQQTPQQTQAPAGQAGNPQYQQLISQLMNGLGQPRGV